MGRQCALPATPVPTQPAAPSAPSRSRCPRHTRLSGVGSVLAVVAQGVLAGAQTPLLFSLAGKDSEVSSRLSTDSFTLPPLAPWTPWKKTVRAVTDSPSTETFTSTTVAEVTSYNCNAGLLTWEMSWSYKKKTWCCINEGTGCISRMVFPGNDDGADTIESINVPTPAPAENPPPLIPFTLHPATTRTTTTSTTVVTTSVTTTATTTSSTATVTTTSSTATVTTTLTTTSTTTTSSSSTTTITTTTATTTTATTTVTATTAPYDCTPGWMQKQSGWSKKHADWCCLHEGQGCSSTTTQTTPLYDCQDKLHQWANMWSDAQKAWCCKTAGAGCTTTADAPYDCSTVLTFAWTVGKRTWCCSNVGKGCRTTPGVISSTSTTLASSSTSIVSTSTSRASTAMPSTTTSGGGGYSLPSLAGNASMPDACSSSCVYLGRTTTCLQTVNELAFHELLGIPDSCERALQMTIQRCPACAACSSVNAGCHILEPLTTRPAHKREDCSAVCSLGGQDVTCTDRIKWAAANTFKFSPNSCKPAYDLVMTQCRMCSDCTLEGAQCVDSKDGPHKSLSPDAYDCTAGADHWRTAWADAKLTWCCSHGGKGACPTSVSDGNDDAQYDCYLGLAHYREEWDNAKKSWCCFHESIACEGMPKSSAVLKYNEAMQSTRLGAWMNDRGVPLLVGLVAFVGASLVLLTVAAAARHYSRKSERGLESRPAAHRMRQIVPDSPLESPQAQE